MLVQRRPALGRWRHLLWSVPLTAPAALVAWIAANTDVGHDIALPLLVASGLLLGAGFMSPWHRSLHVRLTVAAVVMIGWTGWNALAMTVALMSAAAPVG